MPAPHWTPNLKFFTANDGEVEEVHCVNQLPDVVMTGENVRIKWENYTQRSLVVFYVLWIRVFSWEGQLHARIPPLKNSLAVSISRTTNHNHRCEFWSCCRIGRASIVPAMRGLGNRNPLDSGINRSSQADCGISGAIARSGSRAERTGGAPRQTVSVLKHFICALDCDVCKKIPLHPHPKTYFALCSVFNWKRSL